MPGEARLFGQNACHVPIPSHAEEDARNASDCDSNTALREIVMKDHDQHFIGTRMTWPGRPASVTPFPF